MKSDIELQAIATKMREEYLDYWLDIGSDNPDLYLGAFPDGIFLCNANNSCDMNKSDKIRFIAKSWE